jgi:predicted ester cyclase
MPERRGGNERRATRTGGVEPRYGHVQDARDAHGHRGHGRRPQRTIADRIDDIGEFFADGFRWMGNYGCGTKTGLKEFQDNWQRPFQAAFSDKVCVDEARLYMGEWAAAFGRQEATHSGAFMGVAPTGKRVEIRYMDFWKVVDGKIVDNWVMVDFPMCWRNWASMSSTGRAGRHYDSGRRAAPRPGRRQE